jgi:glycosyltransferase involved in cell wall biosynthesis
MPDPSPPRSSRRDGDSLRVLLVTSDKYPPFRPAAKALFASGIPARGHRVDWLMQAAEPGQPSGRVPFGNGTAYIARTTSERSRLSRLLKYCFEIANDLRVFWLLRGKRYALVQIKDKYFTALPALAAARLFRVPIFFWQAYPHAEAASYASENGIARYSLIYALRGRLQRWLLYRVLMRRCDHVFVQSEQMRIDVAAHGIRPESTTAVPSSVDLAEIDRVILQDPAEPPPDGPVITYLGTLLRERQLDFLVLVLAHVVRHVPNARLELIGQGGMPEDERVIEAEAERLNLRSRITITGWLPMEAAWQRVRRASVCLSPYRPIPILQSTSPTKLIEYMALGKPVVANDHPEQSLVLRQSGAGIVCPWDPAAFANAIVRLLARPELCDRMGREGRLFVERYRTHHALSELVVGTYRDVLRRSPLMAAGTVSSVQSARGVSK